ncbi:hypothetical protein WK70_00455 [Burkholderia cepacia]|nr:hypothetical protein WK70_00455 [Burkholderia cepacia]
MLTDRGTEYCGNPEHHEYELYLAVEDIDHTRTKAKSPQANGIVGRLHKTMLNEFYRVAFRKKIYKSVDALQTDLDARLDQYNNEREHQGRWCYGKTPMRTVLDSLELARRNSFLIDRFFSNGPTTCQIEFRLIHIINRLLIGTLITHSPKIAVDWQLMRRRTPSSYRPARQASFRSNTDLSLGRWDIYRRTLGRTPYGRVRRQVCH